MTRATALWVVHVALTLSGAGLLVDGSDPGGDAAKAAWALLEVVARGGAEANWSEVHAALSAAHPHAEASGALAWLHLFGVPDSHGSLELPRGFPRSVDSAVAVARRGAELHNPTCGRCRSLLAFLLSIGFPPLVNVAHTTGAATARPSVIFIGEEVTAEPQGSAEAARLARDIGRPDPVASEYFIAMHTGDAIGVLAVANLARYGIIDTAEFRAPMANQASAASPRRPSTGKEASCDPIITAFLGELAGDAVDAVQTMTGWGPTPQPLSAGGKPRRDKAWLQHVVTNPRQAAVTEVAEVADLIEKGAVAWGDMPRGSGTPAELRRIAAERGSPQAALRVAVDHLQRNETAAARPMLEQAAATAQDASDTEMAHYYMRRYTDEEPNKTEAWSHLVRAAELGRSDAELLVAHTHATGDDVATGDNMAPNASEAMRRYRHITNSTESGALTEVQSYAAYNLGVLSLQAARPGGSGSDKAADVAGAGDSAAHKEAKVTPAGEETSTSEGAAANASNSTPAAAAPNNASTPATGDQDAPRCTLEAQLSFQEVVLARLPLVRMMVALAQRAARLGDSVGALLLSSLLSDLGHNVGHADAAYLWDTWARKRPPHLGSGDWEENATGARRLESCNLTGWWTTSTVSLAEQGVSRVFVSAVVGGGFETFNASNEASGLEGLEVGEVVVPRPTHSQFRHLHSFLWHTTYDVMPDGAPIPVALQPPGAVPHLIEHHHQRGKMVVDEACATVRVEGMYVNWTFHKLGGDASRNSAATTGSECDEGDKTCGSEVSTTAAVALHGERDFLHCWIRPEWYFLALQANLAAVRPAPEPQPGSWEALEALTSSSDCHCHGAFACRSGTGACIAAVPPGDDCPTGSKHCPEVDPAIEPPSKPFFAAAPEVCALAYHRRAAAAGSLNAMHVLSHAYSNGLRGAPKDATEALRWSQRAMEAGDARGRFDVAYSLEFGLGTAADPARAHTMYMDLLSARGEAEVPVAARASSLLALLAASGRYLAGRLLGGADPPRAPWAPVDIAAAVDDE